MKHPLVLPAIALVALLLAACEKVVDVEESEPQLVLNGVPTADGRAFIYFGQTRFFLDLSNDHPVAGAEPTLRVGGVPYTPDSTSRCKYFFPVTLHEGDTVSVDIATPAGSVHAATYVPLKPQVTGFDIHSYRSPSFNFVRASFTLDDHPGIDEIYRLAVTVRDSGVRYNDWTASYDTVDTVRSTYFIVRDEAVTSADVCPYLPMGGYLYSTLMFLDRNIDGQSHPMDVYIMQLTDTNEVHPFLHQYRVDVQSVTPARYNYILSSSRQNSMMSFFTESGEVRGNVSGALGVFAGQASVRHTFDTITTVAPRTAP